MYFIHKIYIYIFINIYFYIQIGLIPIDLIEIFLMEPSKLDIFRSVASYDEKTAENGRNFNHTEMRIVSKI